MFAQVSAKWPKITKKLVTSSVWMERSKNPLIRSHILRNHRLILFKQYQDCQSKDVMSIALQMPLSWTSFVQKWDVLKTGFCGILCPKVGLFLGPVYYWDWVIFPSLSKSWFILKRSLCSHLCPYVRVSTSVHTANASKLIEKCFLDLRNIFLNQENIRKFFSKQEALSSWDKFSRPFHKKVYLNLKNGLKMRTIFLKQEIFSC